MTANRITLIKSFFERADAITPSGGRKVEMNELKALSAKDREELAVMIAKETGVSLETGV